MEHLASRRKVWYTISLIVILPGFISLVLFGLNRGIEFTGGTLWELGFDQPVTTEQINNVLSAQGLSNARVQLADNSAGEPNRVAVIRVKELQQGSAEKDAVAAAITKDVGTFTELQLSSVGSSVSRDVSPGEFVLRESSPAAAGSGAEARAGDRCAVAAVARLVV